MNNAKLLSFPFILLLLTACQFHDSNRRNVLCENYFTLVSDFDHRFPEQDDYMSFIESGYYETFYYNQEDGFNCHYHLEYKDGTIIDDWGNYTINGETFIMVYKSIGEKRPYFMLYHSPTIDFHIIDTLNYDNKEYKIVYQARYLYSD